MSLRPQLALTFLRPLAPPRPSTVRCLRFSTSAVHRSEPLTQSIKSAPISQPEVTFSPASDLGKQASITTSAPGSQESNPTPVSPDTDSPEIIKRPAPNKPYWIKRTPTGNLPAYRDTKRGGNLHLIQIRKIYGDVEALKDELQQHLELEKGLVRVNQLTRHVIIKCPKGINLLPRVLQYLEAQGF